MPRHLDSATLIAHDKAEAERNKQRAAPIQPLAALRPTPFLDAKKQRFTDPGSDHGPSIKCPDIYEALKRKGYSKEKAARISNSRC